jgi:hypothetical protein
MQLANKERSKYLPMNGISLQVAKGSFVETAYFTYVRDELCLQVRHPSFREILSRPSINKMCLNSNKEAIHFHWQWQLSNLEKASTDDEFGFFLLRLYLVGVM